MKETYIVEYYRGDDFVGEALETVTTWSNLMMALAIRKRDRIVPTKFGKIGWDNVTIWETSKTNRPKLLKSGMDQF
jgi:argonaute-like protein implicated in RNA metabolism and viral defense